MNRSRCIPIPEFDHVVFFSKIKTTSNNDCWWWIGRMDHLNCYGVISINGKGYMAHRVSYDIFNGISNLDLVIDHMCMNKSCVNPDHLREVTVRINTLENSKCSAVANKMKTECKHGHSLIDESNIIYSKGKQGGIRRNCLICKRAISRNHERIKRKMAKK